MSRFLGLRGNGLNIAAILGVLMPGIMTVGYNTSVLGGVLSLDSFEKQFPEINTERAHNRSNASGLQGVTVAAFTMGGFLGTLSCIWLGDWLGRRRLMMVGSVVQIIGAILATSACSLAQLISGRVIIGFGVGEIWATIPLWLSEISPVQKRGSHVATKGIFSSLGCATALFLDYGMSFTHKSVAWRLPFAFPVLFSFVILGFLAFLPESPRWLIQQGRVCEAREILAALENTTAEDDLIEARVLEVQSSLALSGKGNPFKQMFCMGPQRTFHRALLAMGVLIFGHLTGATVTTFYSTVCPTLRISSHRHRH
jgi:MFS family permease